MSRLYDCAEHACRYEQGCEADKHATRHPSKLVKAPPTKRLRRIPAEFPARTIPTGLLRTSSGVNRPTAETASAATGEATPTSPNTPANTPAVGALVAAASTMQVQPIEWELIDQAKAISQRSQQYQSDKIPGHHSSNNLPCHSC